MEVTLVKKMIFLIISLLALICFVYGQNHSIVTTKITVSSEQLPLSFHQYKIVHLSDLHNKLFGKKQRKLVNKVVSEKPNLIVFTGDLIDQKHGDVENSLTLLRELVNIAPVYFVTGNHEWWSGTFDSLEGKLIQIGVHILRNNGETIKEGDDTISLVGIDDPAMTAGTDHVIAEEAIIHALKEIKAESDYKILLSHRPELFDLYADYQFNVVLSGHAHGGQFRFPLIGGLVAPNQGFLPTYTTGAYTKEHTTMIVHRGLGNSIIPLRLFNRPEVIAITLEKGFE